MARVTAFTQEEVYVGLIDEQDYIARCIRADVGTSKAGNQQMDFAFSAEWNGKSITLYRLTPLSGKGVGFTRAVLDALGVPYEEEREGELEFDTDDCINQLCIISVKHREYEGKKSNECSQFYPYNPVEGLEAGTSGVLPTEHHEPWENSGAHEPGVGGMPAPEEGVQ